MSTDPEPVLRVDKLLPTQRVAASLARRATPLVLPFGERSRSRLLTRLSDGTEVGLFLPRGTVLRGGTLLVAEDGRLIVVIAAAQAVLQVTCADPRRLMRAAYHLGNRHTPVEVGEDYLRLEDDPVLADMLSRLGVNVLHLDAPFEPEAGAYGGGHRHGHDETFAEDHALAQAAFVHHHGADAAGPRARDEPETSLGSV